MVITLEGTALDVESSAERTASGPPELDRMCGGGFFRDRGFAVPKLRGSTHDKRIHEFTVKGAGMHIGRPFRGVTGLLAGAPRELSADREEINDVTALFEPGRG